MAAVEDLYITGLLLSVSCVYARNFSPPRKFPPMKRPAVYLEILRHNTRREPCNRYVQVQLMRGSNLYAFNPPTPVFPRVGQKGSWIGPRHMHNSVRHILQILYLVFSLFTLSNWDSGNRHKAPDLEQQESQHVHEQQLQGRCPRCGLADKYCSECTCNLLEEFLTSP